ncbi:hypothetical protein [Actinoplanes regularis]|uniref:hypothetical protein n=1 Tax=Actinoplanes regularis TaxID=52697 RepID=UPI0024A29F3C|nr:hypothetical protein [Actinoplanes regularis]GLW33605.1 hypothetical protein Areg01_65430 [Actinoplanes regularis]
MNENLEHQIETTVSSPKAARAVKDSLERLRRGDGGAEFQEIARDLLEGRITLRDLTRSSVYSGVFLEQLRRYKDWEANLTQEQRKDFEREVREAYGPVGPDR